MNKNEKKHNKEAAAHCILLARRYVAQKRFGDAAALFGKAADSYPSFENNHQAAKAYFDIDAHEKALHYFRRCRDMKMSAFHKYERLTLMADSQVALGNYEDAEKCLEEAMDICRAEEAENPGINCLKVAAACDNTGDFYAGIKNYEKATAYYSEGLKIYEKMLETDFEISAAGAASIYRSLGMMYIGLNDYWQAKGPFESALKLYRDLADLNPGKYGISLANTLNNSGNIYSDSGDIDKAGEYYSEAYGIIKELAANKPHEYKRALINALMNLIILYSDKKDVEKTEEYREECLGIARSLAVSNPGIGKILLARVLTGIANSYLGGIPQPDLSIQYAKEAIEILTTCEENDLTRECFLSATEILEDWDNHYDEIMGQDDEEL